MFYAVNIEDHIPPNHLLRGIDRCLDLHELRCHLANYHSHTGRPSIDPELMIRMLIVILDIEATPANRAAEVESTKTMVDRVEARFELLPKRLIGDTAYGTAPMLGWMVEEKGIEPRMPVWDKSARKDDTFSNSDFAWSAETKEYRCPAGKPLRSNWRSFRSPRSHITQANTVIYRASQSDCKDCTMKQQCCPNTTFRKIARSLYENARDIARRIRDTEAYERSRCERKKVEMLFAHLKRILKFDRLRLRGLSGAQDEFILAATAQNLRRLAKLSSPIPPLGGQVASAGSEIR